MKVWYYYNQRTQQEENEARQIAVAARAKRRSPIVVPKQRTLASKIGEYLKAEFNHAVRGAAESIAVRRRIEICRACPKRVDTLDGLVDEGGIGFCSACGCPGSRRSQLSVKLTMAGVVCPLGKFKKTHGTGGTVGSALEAARGVISSARSLLNKNKK